MSSLISVLFVKHVNTTPVSQTAPLFVSLYLVLLAFFILLNSLATYEQERQEKAIRSLQKTFAVPSYQTRLRIIPNAPSSNQELDRLEKEVTDIRDFAKESLRFVRIEKANDEQGLTVTLLAQQLFEAGNTKIKEASLPLISQLVTKMSDWSGNKRIEITILMGTKKIEPTSALIEEQQARAALLAKEFSNLGVDQRLVIAGFNNELEYEYVSLQFTLRDPVETLNTEPVVPIE